MPLNRAFFACVLIGLSLSAQAHLDEPVTRPVGIYQTDAKTGVISLRLVNIMTADLATFEMRDAQRQPVCAGKLTTKGRDWVLNDVQCDEGKLVLKQMVLTERFKFGVIRHALAKQTLPDGNIIGVFLHLGSESTGISETRVSDEKIKALYGEFPDWKTPD
ncbi:hypothetical protein [Rhodoferax sp.]|uniref:hypothetical protein n=1 Tax=Rhodoferax sp. TaxID=50421 RepID=UPI002ACED9A4|nr:hypothetical protein [Rhodoferax sp.]MDZ7919338.1 hypothetical protein [Rhodoferax sp.]